jgi:hypothetical protein
MDVPNRTHYTHNRVLIITKQINEPFNGNIPCEPNKSGTTRKKNISKQARNQKQCYKQQQNKQSGPILQVQGFADLASMYLFQFSLALASSATLCPL